MVLPTRCRPYVVELMLAVFVCLLMALSASELVPVAPADDLHEATHLATGQEPDAHTEVPQPDGHGALHALSLCVAVVVVAGVALVRVLPLAGGQTDTRSARPARLVRYDQPRRLTSSSLVSAGVLLRV